MNCSTFSRNSFKLLALSLLLSCNTHLNANLTEAETRQILSECKIPNAMAPQLDKFFSDQLVRDIFIDRQQPFMLGWFASKLSPENKQFYATGMNSIQTMFREYYQPKLQQIVHKYGIGINGNSKLFLIQNLIPGFLLKIQHSKLPSLPGIYDYFKTPIAANFREAVTPYQNISRVFYNQKIKRFVKENGLNHVRLIEKYLYHIPGKPEALCDDNYIVVVEDVSKFLATNKNRLFSDFMESSRLKDNSGTDILAVRSVYEELLTELVQVITYVGLWDLNEHNVYLIEEDGILKWAFIDTEKPGFGGSEDKSFFQKNHDEFMRNASTGIDGLSEWLMKYFKR
ncbi:MAG: hypothetical protein V1646_00680 [bacterium]